MARRDSAHGESAAQAGTAKDARLRAALLAWYDRERRDLPWRRTSDPYAIWLSEVMLQQTRVETVMPYYHRFLARFPTVHALAEAPLDEVLALWSGLGYYRRARMLHAAAAEIARGDRFPDQVETLRAVTGIGAYTAGAVASIAFGRRAALVDGNVARVLARIFAIDDDVRGSKGLARIWAVAERLVPSERPGDWNQSLMELGATVCAPRDPRCLVCPARDLCEARARGLQAELPRLKPKTKPKPVARAALVAIDEAGRVLLARRREGGTFAGMWEPPSIERDAGEEDVSAAVARALQWKRRELREVERCGEIVHVLSHRRMTIEVVRAQASGKRTPIAPTTDYDACEWIAPSAMGSRGMTTMAKKILRAARVAAQ